MSKTLYFAKINISKIFEVINDKTTIEQIMDKLFISINNDVEFEKIIEKSKEGDNIVEKHKYTFSSINKLDNIPKNGLVGCIIKSHQIYIKQINKATGVSKIFPVNNDEVIQFYFSPYDETIAFYTAHKFGYSQFCEAFQRLINKCSELAFAELKDSFKVSMRTNGVSLSEIKKDLKSLGPIKELTVKIIPPNPMGKIMSDLKQNTENKIKELGDGNITEEIKIFKSAYVGGLDTSSPSIVDTLDNAIGMHSKISDETITGNGYANVVAIPTSGEEYNTDSKQVIKIRIDEDDIIGDINFAEKCIYYIKLKFRR